MDRLGLIDLPILDRPFTWTNMQERLVMAKLDRILVSSDWERYQSSKLSALLKPTSDHVPLCLDAQDDSNFMRKLFRFEKNVT